MKTTQNKTMIEIIDIRIVNEHTFNNWGTFDIEHEGKLYHAKWEQRSGIKKLTTDAPEDVYRRVYNYLFDEEL